MKFETKRNLQAFILTAIFIILLLVINGFNGFGDFIIKAVGCFIFSGIIIVIWEEIKKSKNKTVSYNEFLIGNESFEKGIEYLKQKEFQNALICFNKAIECNYIEDTYRFRADCLFELGYHVKSLQDYNKAIPLEPNDCNLWFMRSHVKNAMSDFDGEIKDLEKAILISKNDTEQNENYNIAAKEMGWPEGITSMYQASLSNSKTERKVREIKDNLRELK